MLYVVVCEKLGYGRIWGGGGRLGSGSGGGPGWMCREPEWEVIEMWEPDEWWSLTVAVGM